MNTTTKRGTLKTGIAATKIDFNLDQLQKFAAQVKDVPILKGFDQNKIIGKGVDARVQDGRLFIDFILYNDHDLDRSSDIYIVPGYMMNDTEMDPKKVTDADLLTLGMVTNPTDKTLPPVLHACQGP